MEGRKSSSFHPGPHEQTRETLKIRDWTTREIAQGKPWAHPTHAMLIHFPTALYPAALVFGLASFVRRSAGAADTATVLIGLGILGTVPAATNAPCRPGFLASDSLETMPAI